MLSTLKRTSMRLGSMTLAFFRKGDELEATSFDALPHDDPTLVPPKLGFRGFDKVPRNRAPLLIALLLVAAAALGVLGWLSARDVPPGSARVANTVRAKASGEWSRVKTLLGAGDAAPAAQK